MKHIDFSYEYPNAPLPRHVICFGPMGMAAPFPIFMSQAWKDWIVKTFPSGSDGYRNGITWCTVLTDNRYCFQIFMN